MPNARPAADFVHEVPGARGLRVQRVSGSEIAARAKSIGGPPELLQKYRGAP